MGLPARPSGMTDEPAIAGVALEARGQARATSRQDAMTGTPSPLPGAESEPRWPSVLAVLTAIVLYVSLPEKMMLGAGAVTPLKLFVPALELALLIPLAVTSPHRRPAESETRRRAAICLTGILSAANMLALVLLVHHLAHGG